MPFVRTTPFWETVIFKDIPSCLNYSFYNIFDFNIIDFVKCSEFATSNFAKTTSELWNNGYSIKQISEELKLHKHTIIAYLKQGNDNGWCKYDVGDGVKRYNENRKLKK